MRKRSEAALLAKCPKADCRDYAAINGQRDDKNGGEWSRLRSAQFPTT